MSKRHILAVGLFLAAIGTATAQEARLPPAPRRHEKDGLAAILPPGHRAIAIKVTADTLVGGFVLPGSRVDVIWTQKRAKDSVSQTLLQNVLVLAVDTQNTRKGEDAPAVVAQTVTLAATLEDCQKLALAANLGELRLALRPIGDDKIVEPKKTTVEDLKPPKE